MSATHPSALFAVTFASHSLILLYAIWRISKRAPIAVEEKTPFVPGPIARAATPETINLSVEDTDPGAEPGAVPQRE